MVSLAATAARAATTTAASAAAPPPTLRILPTLTACAVAPAGRRPFGAPLAATLRVTTHGDAAVAVAAAAAFEVDIAAGGGCGDGGTVSPLAAAPLATLAGDGAVHELALPLGGGLAALQRRLSADALCNVGLLHLALVMRRNAGEPPPSAAGATGAGGGAAAAAGAGGGAAAAAPPGGSGGVAGGPLTAAAVAAFHEVCPPPSGAAAGAEVVVVAERSMAVEVFRDQRAGRVGGEDHDLLFRRVFVEEEG